MPNLEKNRKNEMAIPRVFISYSHDSPAHKEWVVSLATRLRASGVDAVLDLWELQPGDDLPSFMERNLASANRVLMICTEKYVTKANSGMGGVGYEKMIVTAELVRNIDSNKVIPLIRQAGTRHVPTFLGTKLFVDFSVEDQFEFAFDELIRTIHNAPLYVKPEVGSLPDFSEPIAPTKTGDPIFVVMKFVVEEFESNPSTEYFSYASIARRAQRNGMSRMYFDVVIQSAVDQKLLRRVDDFFVLSAEGKIYALQNHLA